MFCVIIRKNRNYFPTPPHLVHFFYLRLWVFSLSLELNF